MVYELRCYTLVPGKMPEYLKAAETITFNDAALTFVSASDLINGRADGRGSP